MTPKTGSGRVTPCKRAGVNRIGRKISWNVTWRIGNYVRRFYSGMTAKYFGVRSQLDQTEISFFCGGGVITGQWVVLEKIWVIILIRLISRYFFNMTIFVSQQHDLS